MAPSASGPYGAMWPPAPRTASHPPVHPPRSARRRIVFTLEQVGSFVPETSVTVDELREPLGMAPSQVLLFTRFLGLDRVASAPGTGLAEMLTSAGEAALGGTDRD